MKDDERHLLGAAQASGEFVPLDGISQDRCDTVLKTWTLCGWVVPGSCILTEKGMATNGAIVPDDEIPVDPVDLEPVITFDADVSVFDEESVTESDEEDEDE